MNGGVTLKKIIGILVIIFCITQPALAISSNPCVRLKTNKGTIMLELDPRATTKTVENYFLSGI